MQCCQEVQLCTGDGGVPLCRALKCDGGQGSIHCDELPMIENFVAVARSLQRSKGIPDSEFRVFVGADKRESYDKVGPCHFPLNLVLLVRWLGKLLGRLRDNGQRASNRWKLYSKLAAS